MQPHGAAQLVDQATSYQRLADHGRAAVATVTGVRATGAEVGGDPELELQLDVDVDGVRRRLAIRQIFSRIAARELGVGQLLSVRLDPADPTKAAVA